MTLFFLHVARNECIISPSPELVTPCVNGYCIDGVGDYSCICNGGFQGRNCSEPIPGMREISIVISLKHKLVTLSHSSLTLSLSR